MTVSAPNPNTLNTNQQAWAREHALLTEQRKSNLAVRETYEKISKDRTLTTAETKLYEDAGFKQMETERQLNTFRLDRSDALNAEYTALQNQLNRTPADQLFLRNQIQEAMGKYC
jgi:hypothetical protein